MKDNNIITDIVNLQENVFSYLYGYMVGKVGLTDLNRDKILDYIDERQETLKILLLSLRVDEEAK